MVYRRVIYIGEGIRSLMKRLAEIKDREEELYSYELIAFEELKKVQQFKKNGKKTKI